MNDEVNYPAFLASEYTPAAPEAARFHVIPVPYERTVSYGRGTANGPRALLEASQQLEAFDGHGSPGEHGISTSPPVRCDGAWEEVRDRIAAAVATARTRRAIPVVIGGEHTVTLGALTPFAQSREAFGVVQIDAHADLRNQYDGTPFSHACVMRRVWELDVPVAQFGVRSLSREEHHFRRVQGIWHMDANTLAREGIPAQLLPDAFPRKLYVSFDVDGLDPAVVPGTGTPEPGGLSWHDACHLLARVTAGRELIGFDVVELAPVAGSHISEYASAKLTYYLMGLAGRGMPAP